MKKIFALLYLFFSFLFILNSSDAQVNQWVWLKGSSTPNAAPNFGTQEVNQTSNEPPAVYEPCEWRDTSGTFWMFGGKDTTGGFYGDLWKYNTSTNQWTWMKGSGNTNDPGNYGTKGVPSYATYPPSIGFGVPTWVDLNNNLWMYGGGNGNYSDDLWKYDIATNEWTWVKGDDSTLARGSYGIQGVPDITNHPGFRQECAATWVDSAGDLWMFGGASYEGAMNDLWRFDIPSNTWTWMKGTNQGYLFGKYGTEGVEESTNIPGGRYVYSHWKDKSGNFWLFGGYDGVGSHFNDMWRYNPSTNNWTWMSGTNILYLQGSPGSKCTFDSTNVPFSRMENRAYWTDTKGDFWMFGGAIESSSAFSIVWNDLWKYCVKSNQWIWISGDTTMNPAGSWGYQGVSNPTNVPDGRAGAVGWSDKKGDFYLFGGTTYPFGKMHNDVWKYTVDTTCANCASAFLPPAAAFQVSDSIICAYDCVNYTDLSIGATSWSWSFVGGIPSSSTVENPQNICYQAAGNYSVILIASNGYGTDTIKASNLMNVIAGPPAPEITISNDTLYCSFDPSYTSYQWYADTVLIPGATNSWLFITKRGNYNVKVTDESGCSTSAGIILGLQTFTQSGSLFTVYPNPAGDEIIINGNLMSGNSMITIYNVLGEKILEQQIKLSDHGAVNVKNLSAGIYFIQLVSENIRGVGRFVKE